MITRNNRTAKKNVGKKKQTSSSTSLTFQLNFQKIQEEISKIDMFGNVATQAPVQQLLSLQEIILQQDFNRLQSVYKKLQEPLDFFGYETEILTKQLTQYSTSELLYLTQAPLWCGKHDTDILRHYCQTIISLKSPNFKCYLVQNQQCQYLAVQKNSRSEIILFQPDQLAMNFYRRRQKFLTSLKCKCSSFKNNQKLSQLSQQIIFLYYQYLKLKEKIVKQIKSACQLASKKNNTYQTSMKELLKQIRNSKRHRTR